MEEKRCAKCLAVIKDKFVTDIAGQYFCSKFCRNEWWAEKRRGEREVYEWWRRGY